MKVLAQPEIFLYIQFIISFYSASMKKECESIL